MGQVLAQNRLYILFMDTCVVNLRGPSAQEDPKGMRAEFEGYYKNAITHDFYANLWYLQGNYSKTYQELRLSQNALQDLYRRVLENYIDETVILLEASAPIIVLTRDQSAKKLLELGFRDLESTRQIYMHGANTNPKMFLNQIMTYQDGILRARRGRRFAILALLEAKVPTPEKTKYQVVTLDDVKNLMEEGEKQTKFVEILNLLSNMTGRNLVPKQISSDVLGKPITLNTLEVHQDNYGRMYSDRRSAFQQITVTLTSDEFHRSDALPKRNSENRNEVPASDSDPIKTEGTKTSNSSVQPAPATQNNPAQPANPAQPGNQAQPNPAQPQPAAQP